MELSQEAIYQLTEEQLGKEALALLNHLYKKENVSEFKIAEKMKVTVNQVRSLLYRFQEKNLVTFTRKKDSKKGWYVYFWTLDMKETKALFLKVRKRQLIDQQQQLTMESQGAYFSCKSKCIRLPFEQALDIQFQCPECGEVLNQEQNPKTIEQLKKNIEQLHKDIELYSMPDFDAEEQEPEKKKPVKKTGKSTPVKKPAKKTIKKTPKKKKPAKKMKKAGKKKKR
ncbi:MAG TPA: hypothetical protein VJB87_04025 [Candidatus Nanoarchaeia archaeon]|nr:hypothetical protein [Candidatus Nanoarchaeia archaeon]